MLFKKSFLYFIVSLSLTFLFSFIFYKKLSLLSFINTSFYATLLLLCIFLFATTVKGGFFDRIVLGFRRTFVSNGKELTKKEVNEMTPLSELMKFDHTPFLISGLMLFILMLIGLILYY